MLGAPLLALWWELAVWPEFGYRRASFPKDSCCTLFCSFPRNYLEMLHFKQSHGVGGCVHEAVTEALLTLQETSEKLIKTSTDFFPR